MSRPLLALVLAGLLGGLPGCMTARTGPVFPEEAGAPTASALIEQLGAPTAVRHEGDGRLLRWDAQATKGLTLGLGYYAARFVLSKHRVAQDRIYARVGPDGRVREVRFLRGSDRLRYRLWPFSE